MLRRGAKDIGVGVGLAAQHPPGGRAGVGAVQVEPDALDELLLLARLPKAGVGALDADLRTLLAGLEVPHRWVRVGIEARGWVSSIRRAVAMPSAHSLCRREWA